MGTREDSGRYHFAEELLDFYTDRKGIVHLPFDGALELGRRFCAAEPATILAGVEATERKWAQEAGRPGDEYMVGLLNEYRAAWALLRRWGGHDAALAQRPGKRGREVTQSDWAELREIISKAFNCL